MSETVNGRKRSDFVVVTCLFIVLRKRSSTEKK